jgi:UDP-glucuronate 4-epimerase
MKILVTGCAGFIGSHLCEKLLNKNNIIIGIDNLNDYYSIEQKKRNLNILKAYENFIFLQENVINTQAIANYKPEKIVHLSAMAGVRFSIENPILYCKNNIEAIINLLEQNKLLKSTFIYASSSSVYGNNLKTPFSEDDQINNLVSPYAASKLCTEIYAQLYHNLYKFSCIGLRFFTVYGPRGRPDMAPYKFIKSIYNQTVFNKYGDGSTFRDYTYIDDIVDGIISALNYNKFTNEVFNLGNNKPVTLNQFIKTCENITGKTAKFNTLDIPDGDVKGTSADLRKSKKYLKYEPKIILEEGIKNTFQWMKEENILI